MSLAHPSRPRKLLPLTRTALSLLRHPFRRVINILKPWITESYVEYEPSDLPLIQAFAQRLPEDVKKREARSLILALETRAAGNGEGLMPRKMTVSHNSPPPPPILPPNRKVLRISDLDVLEVARQLTLVETTTFNRIRGPECLHKSWSGPDPSQGPNIRQGIRLSNEISRWVQVSVLAESQPKTRASVIKFFVQVAEVCLPLIRRTRASVPRRTLTPVAFILLPSAASTRSRTSAASRPSSPASTRRRSRASSGRSSC